jgi:hypothetical protein
MIDCKLGSLPLTYLCMAIDDHILSEKRWLPQAIGVLDHRLFNEFKKYPHGRLYAFGILCRFLGLPLAMPHGGCPG